MAALTVEEMKGQIGRETVSGWVVVTQAMIDRFADATGDDQFIHVDPERAARTPLGGTVAHGFLTLSLLPVLMRRCADAPRFARAVMAINYGCDRLRFISPVRSGSRVRGRFVLVAVEEKHPGRVQQTSRCTVEIEGADKPALVVDWINQVFLEV